jgi:iron only hydrogenase large subunit-like protein
LKPLIEISDEKCKYCYTCIRFCPVKAIIVTAMDQAPKIEMDRCIGCGSCISSCKPGAITYRDDKELVKKLLASKAKVVAMVDPAFASEFPDINDYRKFARMLKQLGFKQVYETSFGVDIIAKQYQKLISGFRGKYFISANCPAVVAYIEKFHPSLTSNLAPIVSPMIAMARIIRKKAGNDIKIVHLGPCIAAKEEAFSYNAKNSVDAVLTFTELRALFDEFNIIEGTLEYSHITEPLGNLGSIYPIGNGFVQAVGMSEELLENNIVTGEGKENMIQYLKTFEQNIEEIKCNFNMFYCEGCIMGPGSGPGENLLKRRALVVEYSNKRIKSLDKTAWQKNIDSYSGLDFSRTFEPVKEIEPEPSEKKIKEILRAIEKPKREDELDCGTCGFETCREFAIAIAKGLTIPEMCTSFAFKNQQNHINSLRTSNEKLALLQAALKESERKARQEHEVAREASETTTAMLQKLPAGVLIIDKNLKIIQANQSFINTLGDEVKEINEVIPGLVGADIKTLLPYTFHNIVSFVLNTNEEVINRDIQYEDRLLNISVFPIKRNKIAGAILRDLFIPEVRKEEIVARVTDAIDKNLEMVQQIGFLLGEGASETERMLNSIIQTYKDKKKE